MTDKVQKIKDWISKEQDGLMDAQGNFDNPSDEGAFHILTNLDYYIDSLEEESASKDLDEAANKYAKESYPDELSTGQFGTGDYEPYVDMSGLRECAVEDFKAGAEWQKEQLMSKSVETAFNVSLPSSLYDKLWIKGCKEGDKLLVIKKDEL